MNLAFSKWATEVQCNLRREHRAAFVALLATVDTSKYAEVLQRVAVARIQRLRVIYPVYSKLFDELCAWLVNSAAPMPSMGLFSSDAPAIAAAIFSMNPDGAQTAAVKAAMASPTQPAWMHEYHAFQNALKLEN